MHRILFTLNLPFIGPLDIYTYGVMMVLGFIFGLTWALKFTKPKDIEPETVLDLSIYVLIGGIIGARLLFVIINYNELFANDFWAIFNLRKGGLAWFGAIAVGILSGYIFSKRHKISFWKLADMFAPPIIIGLAIGRIGCFFNGCCYGQKTDLPWGVVFPDVYPPDIARHPTQIYSAILNIVIFYILNMIDKKKKFYGETFCCFIGLYSITRFVVEYFREWSHVAVLSFIGINQISSLILLTLAIIIGIKLSKNKICAEEDKVPDEKEEPEEIIGTEIKEYLDKSVDMADDKIEDNEDLDDEIM